jgi:hypothetical protein
MARFATYNEADAHFFHDAVAAVLKELHEEAGIVEEEDDVGAGDEEDEAPAPTRNGENFFPVGWIWFSLLNIIIKNKK